MTTRPTQAELDEIARRFEDFDPDTATVYEAGDLATPADVRLTQALAAHALYRRKADAVLREAVEAARLQGLSWHKIGIALGTTGEAARQRFSVRA